jgi:uncharacterized membrane protein
MPQATLFAILAGLCWGIGELFTKSVLNSGRVGPVTALAVRATLAMPVFWMVFAFLSRRADEPRDWLQAGTPILLKLVFGSAMLTGVAGTLAFVTALKLGEVSRVKPIAFALAPATAVVFGTTLFQEPLTLRKVVAVLLILAGVGLLAGK